MPSSAPSTEPTLRDGCARCSAVVAALQELRRWPELPGVDFGVDLLVGGTIRRHVVRPEQVIGIVEAIARHVETLLPFGAKSVAAYQAQPRLLDERDALRVRAETAEAERNKLSAVIGEMSAADAAYCPPYTLDTFFRWKRAYEALKQAYPAASSEEPSNG